jgi:hypothetical protein
MRLASSESQRQFGCFLTPQIFECLEKNGSFQPMGARESVFQNGFVVLSVNSRKKEPGNRGFPKLPGEG